MNDTKPWYQSQGAWASIFQIGVSLMASYHLLSASQAALLTSQGPAVAVSVVMTCLGVWSLYGRLTATKEIR